MDVLIEIQEKINNLQYRLRKVEKVIINEKTRKKIEREIILFPKTTNHNSICGIPLKIEQKMILPYIIISKAIEVV